MSPRNGTWKRSFEEEGPFPRIKLYLHVKTGVRIAELGSYRTKKLKKKEKKNRLQRVIVTE